jgi:ABC-type sulfate/molybdate transport systems ATPase subunit
MSLEASLYLRLASPDSRKPFVLEARFSVAQGEILGLLGPSGSGKSMSLKCVAGIFRPDRGNVRLNEKILFDSGRGIDLPSRERKVGYLFQSYALFPHMSVFKNVASGIGRHAGESYREWRHRAGRSAEQYLEMLHIAQLAARYPRQISGGQQQRVALARLFASQPEAILLDEPFSALDTELKDSIGDDLEKTLLSYGCPVIFVSHDDGEVKRFCSRTIRIRDGRLVSQDVLPQNSSSEEFSVAR